MAAHKIYADNEARTCDYGVDFTEGVALVGTDAEKDAWVSRGYAYTTAAALSEFDKLPVATLRAINAELGLDDEALLTKKDLVTAMIVAYTQE